MAGKHSKSFFDTVSEMFAVQNTSKNYSKNRISLPFKVITIVLVMSLVVSAIWIGRFFVVGIKHENIINQAKRCFDDVGGVQAIKVLSKSNSDIKGWINIDQTDISYAVCQGENDQYYTNHNQLGNKSRYGAVALSAADSFERTGDDRNIVIYGNNMKDGMMFGSLKKYRNLNFYKQNPIVELYYGKNKEKYVIFSVMLISSREDDNGSAYNPSKSHFSDKSEFEKWYDESVARSLIKTNIKAKNGDNMLTLVTSADDFEGARLVLLAKKITNREANSIDTSDAKVNAKTKYPKIWYKERNLEYPY